MAKDSSESHASMRKFGTVTSIRSPRHSGSGAMETLLTGDIGTHFFLPCSGCSLGRQPQGAFSVSSIHTPMRRPVTPRKISDDLDALPHTLVEPESNTTTPHRASVPNRAIVGSEAVQKKGASGFR